MIWGSDKFRSRYLLGLPYCHLFNLGQKMLFSGGNAAFRILIFHDTPKRQWGALSKLIERLKIYPGVISPYEAADIMDGKVSANSHRRVPVLLSFDDGFASNGPMARQILDPMGVKGLFFVCPGLIELSCERQEEAIGARIFDGNPPHRNEFDDWRLMSWNELGVLVQSGHMIASHTMTHARLSQLEGEDLANEVIVSAELIKKRLGVDAQWFAYPFGDFDSINLAALEKIKKVYRYCCSGLRGINRPGVGFRHLWREPMALSAPLSYQKMVASGGLDFLYLKRIRLLAQTRSS